MINNTIMTAVGVLVRLTSTPELATSAHQRHRKADSRIVNVLKTLFTGSKRLYLSILEYPLTSLFRKLVAPRHTAPTWSNADTWLLVPPRVLSDMPHAGNEGFVSLGMQCLDIADIYFHVDMNFDLSESPIVSWLL
jgi:hypothetical protein